MHPDIFAAISSIYIRCAARQSVNQSLCLFLFVCPRGMGGGHFYTQGGGKDNNDVESEEEDVSKANILASKASKISAGARILRGP